MKTKDTKKRRPLDLSNDADRKAAATSLKQTAQCLMISGDTDESVWPLLMGAKALEAIK